MFLLKALNDNESNSWASLGFLAAIAIAEDKSLLILVS